MSLNVVADLQMLDGCPGEGFRGRFLDVGPAEGTESGSCLGLDGCSWMLQILIQGRMQGLLLSHGQG